MRLQAVAEQPAKEKAKEFIELIPTGIGGADLFLKKKGGPGPLLEKDHHDGARKYI